MEKSVNNYLKNKDKNNLSLLRYEDLCDKPKKEVGKICNKIGIKMYKKRIHPEEYGSTRYSTKESHKRLNKEITTKTVGKWRNDLREREIEILENILHLEMDKLGYKISRNK